MCRNLFFLKCRECRWRWTREERGNSTRIDERRKIKFCGFFLLMSSFFSVEFELSSSRSRALSSINFMTHLQREIFILRNSLNIVPNSNTMLISDFGCWLLAAMSTKSLIDDFKSWSCGNAENKIQIDFSWLLRCFVGSWGVGKRQKLSFGSVKKYRKKSGESFN